MKFKRQIIQFVALYQIMSACGYRRAFLKLYFLKKPLRKLLEIFTRKN